MLKLLSRQALKALRNPFRSPLPNPLCGPLQTHHLHIEPAPFSGPPSYSTLAQRFSASSPNQIRFFAQKATKEAMEVDPELYKDMNSDKLHSEISEILDIPYLKEATKYEADKVADQINGYMYGQMLHLMFPCVLSIEDKARWVFFILDTEADATYLSTEVSVYPHRKNTLATNLTLGGTSLRS